MHIGEMLTDYTVLEGVGCLYGPMFPDFPFTFEIGTELVCFENRGIKPTFSSNPAPYFDNTSSCTSSFGLAVNSVAANDMEIMVSPNPVTAASALYLPGRFNGTVTITTFDGKLLYTRQINAENSVNIGDKISLPGMYLYRIIDADTGQVTTGKMVKY